MRTNLLKPTIENLCEHGTEPLVRWLILAAKNRETITYGEAKRRLEERFGFSTIFSVMMGYPAGHAMDIILKVEKDTPLLNVLLVNRRGVPGRGAGEYMATYFNDERLRHPQAPKRWPRLWKQSFERAAQDVYAFSRWDQVYKRTYNRAFSASDQNAERKKILRGREQDGLPRGRTREGANHKALRLWVTAHPERVVPNLRRVRTDTEVDLLSGDRVDSVYYSDRRTIALEVKSKDSNEADLRRGIYQCVKYRAVLTAMDGRANPLISAILVTETALSGDLVALAHRLRIPHFLMPKNWRK